MKNKELDLAWKFVTKTNRNIFLTGKAGTGKTTFLHKLKREVKKRMVVVAPTGVAAINAKGVTIHSFFQMPFGPILPNTKPATNFNRKFSKLKINLIKSLDLLVIDEISMVRADLLDAIDQTLRRFKNRNLVFGGAQLLMIGDLQQLSPVVKDNEWRLLQAHYQTPFFFSSQAYSQCNPLSIELKHIYRQENPVFISILNEIRTNTLSQTSAHELNKRYIPDFSPQKEDGYISLTTHNASAIAQNTKELASLKGPTKTYKASVEGDFPEHIFPNKNRLSLKVGAQVMFIRNDRSTEKRYFNGKIGRVVHLSKDEVVVHCPDDDFNIITTPETWENIKYNVNPETKAITEQIVGSYTQMPLRLAWAITIHKSQGLTFEKAIIDVKGAFAHGQTYVALSRCKSLEGLVLKTKIDTQQIINDSNVNTFNKQAELQQPNEAILLASEITYQLELIAELFDFYPFLYPIKRLLDIYYKNRNSIEGDVETPITTLKDTMTYLLKINTTFKEQLKRIVGTQHLPELQPEVQDRFKKAIVFFQEKTKLMRTAFETIHIITDNKAVENDINKHLDNIDLLLKTKHLYFKNLANTFKVNTFLQARASASFIDDKKPVKKRKTVIDGTKHVVLFEQLKTLRDSISKREKLIHYQIYTQKSIYAICQILPTSKEALKHVHGLGKTRIEKYGSEIIEVVKNYCTETNIKAINNLDLEVTPIKPKKKIGETKLKSLELFTTGNTITEIAKMRELTTQTIKGHLAHFIPTGEVKVTDLIAESTYNELKKIIPTITFEGLSDLKNQLDNKYSYEDIRLVLNTLSIH